MSQDTEAGTGAQPAPAQQPEALRLAEFLEARQTHLGSWRGSCDEYDRQDWDDYIKAWELLRSQHARIAELEALPAQACLHRIADMRNANVASGFMCVDCGAIFAAAPALQAAPPAPAAVAVPEGFALVPKRLTRAMEMVLCADEEGWQWEDLLAAAEAITEEEHAALAAAPAQASPSECDSPELCRVHRGCAGQYGTKNTCPSFAVLNPCNPAAPAQEHATQLAGQGLAIMGKSHISPAAPAQAQEDARDATRLDFLIEKDAFIVWTDRDGSIRQCQLLTQDEDENYHVLSGEHRYFNTPREAIDAARAAQGGVL